MPLPPAHFFAGAGAADLARGSEPLPRWQVWLVGGAFGVLPDIDTAIGILLGRPHAFHGIFTHTTLAVLTVGLLVWAVAGRTWGRIAAAAYASHLLADLFEERDATSVQPLWPVSEATLPPLAGIAPTVPWERGVGVEGAAESLLQPGIFAWLVAQTAMGAAFFVLAVLLAEAIRRLR